MKKSVNNQKIMLIIVILFSSLACGLPILKGNPTEPGKSPNPLSSTSIPEQGILPTPTIEQYIPSQVDIYGRDTYNDPAEWIMNGTIFAFGPIVGTNIDWIHELQGHGAKAFSNISTWNSVMAKTVEDLPAEIKNTYLTGFDGQPLIQQEILFLNILDPDYQEFIKKGIREDIDGGTNGISVDEHQGTAQAVWNGDGPCDKYSLTGFKDYLKQKYTFEQLNKQGVTDIETFNYCDFVVQNDYREDYRNDLSKVPFSKDYIHYLYSASNKALEELLTYARDYAASKDRTLVLGANFDPLDRIDEASIFHLLDLFIFEHDWFPGWRNESAYYKFPAGAPVSPEMKYAAGLGKSAAAMYIIADGKELAAQGKVGGTQLINHQFAESYANRGYYMYFDLNNFLGLNFQADRSMMIPYYQFVRNYPELLMNLEQKNDLAVVLPPHFNTYTPSQKEWVFGVSAALSGRNVQHDFIDLEKITNYKVVIVDGNSWSDSEISTLMDYIKNGGVVISFDKTFASMDENYQNKSRSEISSLKKSGTHPVGKGKFIFFTEDMGWKLWANQDPKEITKLVDSIEQFVKLDSAPANIQVIPYTSGSRLVIQILNYDYQDQKFVRQNNFLVQINLPDGFTAEGKTLKIVSPDFEVQGAIEYTVEGNVLSFTVPVLNIWEIAIFE